MSHRHIILGDMHPQVANTGMYPSDMGHGLRIALTDAGAINSIGYRHKYAASRVVRTIHNTETDFDTLTTIGDFYMLTSFDAPGTEDMTSDDFQCIRSSETMVAPISRLACNFRKMGNHERTHGKNASANSTAGQKQATVAIKLCVPNPLPTTYLGGEENSSADWIAPGLAGTAYVVDAAGLNTSPLENYWAMKWGPVLFCFLDTERYSMVGQTTTYATEPNDFRLGEKQFVFMRSVAHTPSQFTVILGHSIPGGIGAGQTSSNNFYARGDWGDVLQVEPYETLGVAESTTQRDLALTMQAAGCEVYLYGHDHSYIITERLGTSGICVGNSGPPSHTQNPQLWHWRELANSHGTAESCGLLDYDGNSRVANGAICHYHAIGYTRMTVDGANPLVFEYVQCVDQTQAATETAAGKYQVPGFDERFIANVAAAPSASKTLSLVDSLNAAPEPEQVYATLDESALVDEWWEGTYDAGALVDRTGCNKATTFQTSAAVSLGAVIRPTVRNGWLYRVTTAGTTHSAEPVHTGAAGSWPTTEGGTVTSGTAVLTAYARDCQALAYAPAPHGTSIGVTQSATSVRAAYVPRVLHRHEVQSRNAPRSRLRRPGVRIVARK